MRVCVCVCVCVRACTSTHNVVEEEEATEEAEEVGGEQREVDGGGAGQLHHHGHAAVQHVHAHGVGSKQQAWSTEIQRGGQGESQGMSQYSNAYL